MAVKLKSVPLVMLCALLATPDARAENCRLSVSQPRIDYGAIRREALVESTSMALGTRSLSVNVLCAEPAAIALRFVGVAADGESFRFGRQGHFRLNLKHARLDGQAVGWAPAHSAGETVSGHLLPGQTLIARVAGGPRAGRQFTAQVDIDTDLAADAFQVRSETHLEGQGSFELISPVVPLSQ